MINIRDNIRKRKKIIVYLFLIVATFAVYWQANQYDFITFDDRAYVTENLPIQSGITPEGVRWAFSTKYFGLWNPLVWLSLMLDYQLFGLKAGGYHLTNLIFHILSTLLLFWLFHRMTRSVWKSAFVSAFFALHPMHVESVAWIAERKDVLSAFFWMLTLCLYVYYVERPILRRYLAALFSFILALMSKPMVVTLPVIMILLDYWPLNRFKTRKENLLRWQLKEKIPFIMLSAIFSFIALYPADSSDIKQFALGSRLANAPVSFVGYLEKTFWPQNLSVFYPFLENLPVWQIVGSSLVILGITIIVILMFKRLPYLFVGWFWYFITILPVIGILQISLTTPYAMADRYHYLPSIGIAVILAWAVPSLVESEEKRKIIMIPAALVFISVMSLLSWKQCSYWEDTNSLFSHALLVTKDNSMAHNNLGIALFAQGKSQEAIDHYHEAIRITPYDAEPYYNRGTIYEKQGNYKLALDDLNKAIKLKNNYKNAYVNRGNLYLQQGDYQRAIADYNHAIRINAADAQIYYNRGIAYSNMGDYQRAIEDYNKAINLNPSDSESFNNRGAAYAGLQRDDLALKDFDQAIDLNPHYIDAYNNRALVYFKEADMENGCIDAQKACSWGDCRIFHDAKTKRRCP